LFIFTSKKTYDYHQTYYIKLISILFWIVYRKLKQLIRFKCIKNQLTIVLMANTKG